jgi:hypothetical protein
MDVLKLGVLSSAAGFLFCMVDEDVVVHNSMRRRHRYWMSPYLADRCNPNQRNTLAKLEMDFIRVSANKERHYEIVMLS